MSNADQRRRTPLVRMADAILAAAILVPMAIAISIRLIFRYKAAADLRKLLVLDNSYSLKTALQRGLQQPILARDLGGYFDHVWTIHPMVGADPEGGAPSGPIEIATLGSRHTILEAHSGRFLALAALPRTNFLIAQAVLLRNLDRLVRREHVSLIRAGDPYYLGLVGILLARFNKIPLVVRIGANDDELYASSGRRAYPRLFPSRSVERRVATFVLRRADLVAGANRDNLEAAIRNGARRSHSVIFRYGNLVDPIHFTDPAQRTGVERVRREVGLPGRRLLVFIGRLEPAKRVDDLVSVMATLLPMAPDVGLVIVGDGTLRSAMEADAAGRGVSNAISFVGNRPQDWIAALLPSATAIVSPHMGRALVEASLAGVPIVAYDLDWHAELVTSGKNGYLVPPRQPSAMANAILQLLADKTLADRMGTAAREAALDMMDPERLALYERATYERLLSSFKPASLVGRVG